ncbi:hypothetical protein, partial [Pseudoalteromonas shioyasakiensis]
DNIERDRTEEVQEYVDKLKELKLELRKKVIEHDKLTRLGRKALDEGDEDSVIGYNSMLAEVVKEMNKIEKRIEEYEIYIKNNSTSVNINENLIVKALHDFEGLFEVADNKTRKALIGTLIKKIEMENDRETIKSITLWFEEDNDLPPPPSLFFGDDLPEGEAR